MNPKQPAEYFRAPQNYFWQWSEGSVIEWKNGITICYRDDLLQIMRSLNQSGVPSLSAMLLVLAACNDSWKTSGDCTGILHGLIKVIPQQEGDSDDDVLSLYINRAIAFMDIIAQLPSDIRKGYRRAHVLHEIFSLSPHHLSGTDVTNAIDEYNSLSPKNYLYSPPVKYTRSQFINDLTCLTKALEKYPVSKRLEMQLRTGLTAIPLPAPLELPEQKPADLLQELLEEPKTTGISRLAKKIIAALNIPMHLQRSGGQSYGGISDITNRGNFDRLLLSELANDDMMLMNRLVNNEALYLRREEPPHTPKTKRVLLIDSTLKLWGVPRVFAVSAAIACTQNIHHGEAIEAYTLGGNDFTETDLTTRQGVLQSLQQLDATLHCTMALSACLSNISGGSHTDCIFITSEETVHDLSFQKWLASSGDSLGFLITVNRNGSLLFNSLVNGHLKQLTAAKFDLEALLFKVESVKNHPPKIITALSSRPAFFYEYPEPLLYPAANMRLDVKNTFNLKSPLFNGLVGITENQRLLYWKSKDKGAKELLTFIETGLYSFGDDSNEAYLLVNESKNRIILYRIDLLQDKLQRLEIAVEQSISQYSYFKDGLFYVIMNLAWNDSKAAAAIDCTSGTLKHYLMLTDCPPELKKNISNVNARTYNSIHIPSFKKLINNGYTVHIRIKNIYIDSDSCLCIDFNRFSIPTEKENFITLKEGAGRVAKEAVPIEKLQELEENSKLWLKQFVWPDGSIATVDSRGLLHVKSSDTSLPEVTIILIQGRQTTCWASDDTVCGSDYFRESISKLMPVNSFYTKYITPIIQRILQA